MSKIKKQENFLLLLVVVFFWFAQYVYIPYQTPYLTSISVSANFVGTIIGAYGISQLLLRLPIGILADLRPNHKLIISIGVLCAGLASLIRFFFPSGLGFLLGNIFSGFASATWISFMVYYLSLHEKQLQASATSKIIMANNLGMLLGFITSSLLYNFIGMAGICLLSFASGIMGFVISLKLKKTTITVNPKITVTSLLKVYLDKQLLLFSFLALIQQGIQIATTMSFTNQIIKDAGASDILVGLSSIIYMFSAVLFSRISSTLTLTIKLKRLIVSGSFTLLAVYCLLVPLTSSIAIIYLLQIIPGIGTGMLFSLLTSESMVHVSLEKKSSAMGLFQAIYAIGMTIFPISVGQINSAISLTAAYWVLAGLALGGAIMGFIYYQMAARYSTTDQGVTQTQK